MTRLPPFLIFSALAGVVATASPAVAQQRGSASTPQRVAADRGWVGVSLSVETSLDRNGAHGTTVRVTDVSDDSPAALAGIQAGDLFLSINGIHSFPQDLRAGDTVRIVLQRSGRQREVLLTAAPRPHDVSTVPVWTVTAQADSIVDRMYQAMDSLRISLVRGRPGEVLVNMSGAPQGGSDPFPLAEVRPPFGFYLFRGEAHDSLSNAMDDLNQRIRDLRMERTARLQILAREADGNVSRIDRSDPELIRLDRAMADADHHASMLRDAMDRVARRETLGSDSVGGLYFRRMTSDPEASAEQPSRFRPLDPYLLGQNRAAGAEVVDLRPELADYFGVDGGVLVVDVTEKTPAALAGIQPGDVLVQVGRTHVRSIQELRIGLAGTAGEIPVTVVRKGQSIQVMLKR